MLVVDHDGGQVLLFDASGTLQASLTVEDCHPGALFRPLTAHFGGDEFIFVQSSGGRWGFRFTSDGVCLGPADMDYTSQRFFDVDPTGALYDSYFSDPTRRILRRLNSAGKPVEEFVMPRTKYPNATQRVRGGGLIADGNHVFVVSAVEPQILKFALDGTLDDRIVLRNSRFRFARRDLADASSHAAFLRGFHEWVQDITTIEEFFELTDESFLVLYRSKGLEAGYQVLSKEGEVIAEEMGIELRAQLLHGAHGMIYRTVRPGSDSDGEFPNPRLEVYRFVAQ